MNQSDLSWSGSVERQHQGGREIAAELAGRIGSREPASLVIGAGFEIKKPLGAVQMPAAQIDAFWTDFSLRV